MSEEQDYQEYQDYLEYQEYLKDIKQEKPSIEIKRNGLLKSSLEALPTAGAMFGGAAGFASPVPGGALIGTGLGASLGKTLENIGEKYLLDEQKGKEVFVEPQKEAAYAMSGEFIGPLVSKGLSKTVSGIGKGLKKTVSSLATIPEKAIETYMERPKAVKAIGQLSEETSLQDAADNLRKNATAAIADFKMDANNEISYILSEKGKNIIDITPIKKIAEDGLSKLDLRLERHQKLATDIQTQLKELNAIAINPNAKTLYADVNDVHNLKQILQDSADFIAKENPGYKDDLASATIRRMSTRARKEVEIVAPEIRKQNQKLMQLHRINRNINKNLLIPEKTAASVMGVGSGGNQQAIKQMKKLEDLIGFPYVKEAQNIVSAQYFNNPPLMPAIQTGRGAVPILTGIGHTLGQLSQGNLMSAAAGLGLASLGSPLMIKGGMDIGLAGKKAIQAVSPLGAFEMAEQLMNRALQMGVAPYVMDGMIQKSEEITNTMKAKLRTKNAKAVK